jgi:hypothetical protein
MSEHRRTRVAGVTAALLGALVFALLLVTVYARQSQMNIRVDVDLPAMARGFYPAEGTEDSMFAWTRQKAELSVPALDRHVTWRWTGLASTWRPAGVPKPMVRVSIDGVVAAERTVSGNAELLEVVVPKRAEGTGVTLTFDTEPGFVPGPSDTRNLGIALASMSLAPVDGWPRPPTRALTDGMLAILMLGLCLAAVEVPPAWLLGCAMAIAAGQAWVLTRGLVAHSLYPRHVIEAAFWTALGTVSVVWLLKRVRRMALSTAALGVVAVSTAACYLKLLVLLHPAMPIGDGVFHAHRFESVLSGHFYFTSLAPGDYAFPYPILLYLFAAPFSLFTHATLDRVALLRIIVTVADAAAGASLYWMVVRSTGNRMAAVTSVIWYHLIPMTSWIMRWGNLTNAFGQPLFVASLVAVVAVPVERAQSRTVALLTVLVGAALLTHPSTCAILVVVLGTTTILYGWFGGQSLRGAAYGVGLATLAAVVVAFVVYYAWFPAVYVREFSRIAAASTTLPAAPGSSMGSRLARVPDQAGSYFGWPVLVAAAIGLWRLRREGEAPRLALLLAAWAGTCVLFLGIGVLTPVEMRYHFAAFPAIALMAAFGWSWAWRNRLPFRVFATLVLSAAVWVGFSGWMVMLG